jgi:UDP-hydrolysing UDP-N-acetyl-D-glucosamine 2-epimerase
MSRKVCVVTGSRAEYGLLQGLMREIVAASELELQVAVTGMHLSRCHGMTVREIEADGFAIDAKVDIGLGDDSGAGVAAAVGRGVIGFADAFRRLQPDILVVLGDRFEILAVVEAALISRIPIGHIHGGEVTEGAIDDAIRHAITKMSHLHFVAAEPYRRRVIQMGESPDRVFNVGALGVDNVLRMQPLDRVAFERAIGWDLGSHTLLVTCHPETLARVGAPDAGITALLLALDAISDARLLFTSPNADPGSAEIIAAIEGYVAAHPERAVLRRSLGHELYRSALAHVSAMIGNSSSGIIEAPAAGLPAVNIGDRQKGRLRSASVIDCVNETEAIAVAIRRALTPAFRDLAKSSPPAYGSGDTARRVCATLAAVPLEGLSRKVFHDLA